MTYFEYGAMIGTTKEDIIKTAEYYVKERGHKDRVPAEDRIYEVPHLKIECWYPMHSEEHWMDLEILPDFTLNVNANALMDVIDGVSRLDEKAKRGELYKFQPTDRQTMLISEKLVNALKEFDWKPYAKRAGIMMGILANKMAGAPHMHSNNIEDTLLLAEKEKPKDE